MNKNKGLNLPNKLTIGRIVAVPFFIAAVLLKYYVVALVLFVLAAVTDFFDGQIARKKDLITNFGKIMDPLADKILVYSAFCLFVADGTVPAWMFIIILAREFLVAGMRTVAASEGIVVAADMSGKIKTVLQMIAVPLILIAHAVSQGAKAYGVINVLGQIFLWASVIMTVYSGYEYISKNKSVFRM